MKSPICFASTQEAPLPKFSEMPMGIDVVLSGSCIIA